MLSKAFWRYLWKLIRSSFHGAWRLLESTEVIAAVVSHSLGHYYPEWKEKLEVLFLAAVALFVLTFFVGLIVAAHALDEEKDKAGSSNLTNQQKEWIDREKKLQEQISIVQQEFAELKMRLADNEKSEKNQRASSYTVLTTIKHNVNEYIREASANYPKSGGLGVLQGQQELFCANMKVRISGLLKQCVDEASKVRLNGYFDPLVDELSQRREWPELLAFCKRITEIIDKARAEIN